MRLMGFPQFLSTVHGNQTIAAAHTGPKRYYSYPVKAYHSNRKHSKKCRSQREWGKRFGTRHKLPPPARRTAKQAAYRAAYGGI